MTTDSLFNIEPTKPTPLQSARRALADAERELADVIQRHGRNADYPDQERAVDRFAALVAEEEKAELNKLQNP